MKKEKITAKKGRGKKYPEGDLTCVERDAEFKDSDDENIDDEEVNYFAGVWM